MTPEQAIEKLTLAQYDFLVECNINLDDFLLTPQQQATIRKITRAPRPSGLTYTKHNHTDDLKSLYQSLIGQVEKQGAQNITPHKNLRDLGFTINDINYHIVLSRPRPKKL